MPNLVDTSERQLGQSLEGPLSRPVILIDPDGVTYDKSKNNPTKELRGRITYDSQTESPETGPEVIVHNVVATLRISSLERVPKSTDAAWAIKFSFRSGEPLQTYSLTRDHAPEVSQTLGITKLFPQEPEQS